MRASGIRSRSDMTMRPWRFFGDHLTINSLISFTTLTRSLVIVAVGLLPNAALADEVVLKSVDGTVDIAGEYLDFVDDSYVIQTALGELRISASRVRCVGDACPKFETDTANVTFAGSDTIGLGMMPLLLTGYASFLNAESSVNATQTEGDILTNFVADGGFGDEMESYRVISTTSGDAFTSLLQSSAQIGMASRRIKPDEARQLKADGAGNMISTLQEHVVAVDSLVIIVNPENEVASITTEQLRGIYSGTIKNWSELGGSDAPIKVFDRQTSSGTRSIFMNAIFGEDSGDAVEQIGVVAEDSNDMAAKVFADPTAIGFVGYAFQRGASSLALVNECGIQTTPDAFSAKTEEYPLQRRLYLYNRADNLTDATADFITYATSSEADGVIAKSGFIDLGVTVRDMDLEGARAKQLLAPDVDPYESGVMREMLRQMLEFDRLSTTFRFTTGSSRMDERSLVDMARLVNYLATQPTGTTVMFAGFTDSVGAFDSNRALSDQRAAYLAQQFSAFAGDKIGQIELASAGFGEIAPVACNTDGANRSINRRVEVWIKPPL